MSFLLDGPRRLFWAALFLSGIFPIVAKAEVGFSKEEQVHIQADSIEYLKDQGLVVAKGGVHIRQGSVHLYADQVRYDANAQDIQASGHVVWRDGSQEVTADHLTYNLGKKEGKASKIKSFTPPWISYGEEVLIQDKRTVILKAVTTTCDYPEGYRHYSLVADKITIHSGDYLVAENVVLYIGKVPVFYFPVFVRTVHEIKTPFSFSTGSTDYLGNYLLLTTNYLFSPVNYGALYTDYFFKRGFGLGLRHEIALNDISVLSLYGYGVPENGPGGRFRWEARVRGLWALSSSFFGRVEAGIPGDGLFSQDYSVARRDPSLVSTQRDYNLSATFTRTQFTLGLLVRRQESADVTLPARDVFTPVGENLPQLTFTLFPRSLFFRGGPLFDLTAQADRYYTKANGSMINRVSGTVGLSQSLALGASQNFSLRTSLQEAYQDGSDFGLDNDGETTALGLDGTWMGRWAWFLSTTLTYGLSKKLNGLRPTDPVDGLRSHQVSASMDITTGTDLRFRTSLSYDMALKVPTQAERFSFLRQEGHWIPSPEFSTSVFMNYSIKADALKDVNAVLSLRSPIDTWRVRLWGNYVDPNVGAAGMTVTGTDPTFRVGGEAAVAIFEHYRVSFLQAYNVTRDRSETRSISLYRDLHDWEAEVNYAEDSAAGKRVFFKLNLKVFPGKPLNVSEDELQRLDGLRNQGLSGAAGQFN